jgi:hypothetical protein
MLEKSYLGVSLHQVTLIWEKKKTPLTKKTKNMKL